MIISISTLHYSTIRYDRAGSYPENGGKI